MEARRILRYLPENYQFAAADIGGITYAMLQIMEGMHAPVDRVLRSIDDYFDPFRAPEAFVLLQASWLGLDRYFDWSGGSAGIGEPRYAAGTDQLRLLIAEFPSLVRSRGTQGALTRFLQVATGISGFLVEDGAQAGAFHVIVHVPGKAGPLDDLIRRIVSGERPAHATWEIQMIEDQPGDQKE